MPATQIDGLRLHYLDVGPGHPDDGAPVLVLLHGIGDDGASWDLQLPAFGAGHRVIAPDLRGYGASERQPPYTVERFAADVWALLDALGIARFDLVGHSMGGAVALQMAVDRPACIGRLVLANTLPSFRADTPAKLLLFLRRWLLMRLLGPARLAASIARSLFPAPEQAALRERSVQRGRQNDRDVYLATISGLRRWSVEDRLGRLTLPVLLIVSEFDYFPRADAERFAARLPDARLRIFAGARHALREERPDAFNDCVLAFLARDGAAA